MARSLIIIVIAGCLWGQTSSPAMAVDARQVMVAMRDGFKLKTTVWLPDEGAYPVVLTRGYSPSVEPQRLRLCEPLLAKLSIFELPLKLLSSGHVRDKSGRCESQHQIDRSHVVLLRSKACLRIAEIIAESARSTYHNCLSFRYPCTASKLSCSAASFSNSSNSALSIR